MVESWNYITTHTHRDTHTHPNKYLMPFLRGHEQQRSTLTWNHIKRTDECTHTQTGTHTHAHTHINNIQNHAHTNHTNLQNAACQYLITFTHTHIDAPIINLIAQRK